MKYPSIPIIVIIVGVLYFAGISFALFFETPATRATQIAFGADTKSRYAEIAPDGTVLRVIVADKAFIDSGAVGDPANWIRTEKKTVGKNYAGKGHKYDPDKKAFIAPKPTPNATLDPIKNQWVVPLQDIRTD